MSSHGIKLARFISALILVEKLQLSHRTACSDLTEGAEILNRANSIDLHHSLRTAFSFSLQNRQES
jgi:hypothetical protein